MRFSPEARCGPLLDLGCGTGSFLASLSKTGVSMCGVDIAMRWLLVARKRLDEEGRTDVPLGCACAEDLPIRSERFAAVIAGDVIEHVRDQARVLNEAHRILAPRGELFLASPNRYSLAPEPHVQVWGVGFLPRSWMTQYVRAVNGVDFRAIRTMGYFEWTRLLGRSPFGSGRIEVPSLPPDDLAAFRPFKRWVARVYNAIVATRLGTWLARAIGPLFHVVCTKPVAEEGPRSSPATRQRSTPSTTRV